MIHCRKPAKKLLLAAHLQNHGIRCTYHCLAAIQSHSLHADHGSSSVRKCLLKVFVMWFKIFGFTLLQFIRRTQGKLSNHHWLWNILPYWRHSKVGKSSLNAAFLLFPLTWLQPCLTLSGAGDAKRGYRLQSQCGVTLRFHSRTEKIQVHIPAQPCRLDGVTSCCLTD